MQYCCAVGPTLTIAKTNAAENTPAEPSRARTARAIATPQSTEATVPELAVRLLALLEKMQEHADVEDVHRLRTTVRRLEVHLTHPPKKVARALRHLRKEAGTLRDLDVHLELLKRAPFTARGNGAAHELQAPLRELLAAERGAEEKVLLRCAAKARAALEHPLPEAAREAEQPAAGMMAAKHAVAEARGRYLRLAEEIPEEAGALHGLRIAAKKLRYGLEPLAGFRDAAETAALLKQVQDAIGTWHDWATLLEIADHELQRQRETAAFQAIEARTAREFARARRVAGTVR